MGQGILKSIQNFCPNICGIRKWKGNWFFKDELEQNHWLPLADSHHSVRKFIEAADKFRIEDFQEEVD